MIFILEAIISDMILFAGIQNAMDKLMHPTTLYGWAFVATVPFMIYFLFKKKLEKNMVQLARQNFKTPLFIGLFSFITMR